MEAANWAVIDQATYNFQFRNESTYYAHHMSMYEHYTRKVYGYEKSENMTAVMADAAMKGECHVDPPRDYHSNSLAIVPFYGGRPPNVTADLKVKSLGQGNSLVSTRLTIMHCT